MTFYHEFTTSQQKDSYHIIIGKRKCNDTYKTNFLYNVIIPIRLSDLIQHETQIMFHHNVKMKIMTKTWVLFFEYDNE